MNNWTNKDMTKLSIMAMLALSISLALFVLLPIYIEDHKERIEVLEEKLWLKDDSKN